MTQTTAKGGSGRRRILVAALFAFCTAAAAQPAAPEAPASAADPAASAPARQFTHRPLRSNQPPPPAPVPTDVQVFKGYADAPPFTVVTRRENLLMYPCSQCHNLLPLNLTPRKLVASPHQATLRHGDGRFWCMDCHLAKDRQWLHTLDGAKVDFNDAALVCGQCHGARHRDWAYGGHGKRVAGWTGEREIYACTHCHNPHEPALMPRQASKAPPVRAGLAPMNQRPKEAQAPWQHVTTPGAHR